MPWIGSYESVNKDLTSVVYSSNEKKYPSTSFYEYHSDYS